jgi:Ca2+-binding EF-hand superfamily protein
MTETLKRILDDDKKLEEVAKVAFDSVNTDKSGQINYSELESVMTQISNDLGTEPPTSDDVKEVLKHLDTDKNGLIDFNEFKVLITDVLNAMIKEMNK